MTAASHSSLPPTELSAADLEASFDEIVELYARPETPRKVPEEKPPGRTLDELPQSPIWELELTCSPIKETPEKVAPKAPRLLGRHTSRQLFPEDDREDQAPDQTATRIWPSRPASPRTADTAGSATTRGPADSAPTYPATKM